MPKASKATPAAKKTAAKAIPAKKEEAKKAQAAPKPAPVKATTKGNVPAKKAQAAAKKAPSTSPKAPSASSKAPAAASKASAQTHAAPTKGAAKKATPVKETDPKVAPLKKPASSAKASDPAPTPTAKKAVAAASTVAPPSGGSGPGPTKKAAPVANPADAKFLEEQRALLLEERGSYDQQATALKAEADQLAAEMEPGDVQFDEESGEGDSIGMERERDLQLAGQARAAIEEIDRALAKIDTHTYGICERCEQPIPRARLKALPYAALCVACKSGGLTSRR